MTEQEKQRLLGSLDPWDTWKSAPVRAAVRQANLSQNEEREIITSLGGIMCDCDGAAMHALGPAGKCDECGATGPFYVQALQFWGVRDDSPAARYQRLDWEQVFKEEPDDVRWLKEDFLEEGTLSCLFSKPGVGKSLLSLEVCLEIVRSGRTVSYLDDENRRADIADRLRSMGAKPAELGNLIVYNFQNLPPLDTERGGEHLDALAERDKPDLVVLDTVSRMIAGNENDADTFIQLYRCSLTRLKARGITVLRLDHSGKDSARGQRGSSAKESDADVLWYLSRDGETSYSLECQKSRAGHIAHGQIIRLERQYDPLRHDWHVQVELPLSHFEAVMRQMDILGIPTSLGRDKVRAVFRDNCVVGVRNDQLQAAIIERRNRERRARSEARELGGTAGR